MSAGFKTSWPVWVILTALLLASESVRAQTNTPAATPAPVSETAESDLFFERYTQAARLVREKRLQEAAVVMDLLSRNLSHSPWLEVAILKYSELCEGHNDSAAMEGYSLLSKRLDNAPYFQGDAERARVFKTALQGAVNAGIDRMRVGRIKQALADYYAQYRKYPESLAKLAILNFVDMDDIVDSRGQQFRYIPTGIRQTPYISYHQYEGLQITRAYPFSADSPRLQGTSLISDKPKKYAALLLVPGRIDAQQVVENQTLEGYFIGAIAPHGAIACTTDRILVLPIP
jgi:hypothetical protein